METLLDRLKRKLAEAKAEKWEHSTPQDVVLDDDTRLDPSGKLVGGLTFRVMDRAGAWHTVHQERTGPLVNSVELDDFLARGFSRFLMKHPSWPK